MRLFPVLMLLIVSTLAFAERLRLAKPWPTELEKFVNHRHTQIVEVHETARFGDSDGMIRVAGVIARNTLTHPSEMRGVWITVRAQDTEDNVYLPLFRAHALRARIAKIGEDAKHFDWTVFGGDTPIAVLGTEDCRPSQPLPRMHKLCVGLYKRGGESGVVLGANVSLFLANFELVDLLDSIDSALTAIESP